MRPLKLKKNSPKKIEKINQNDKQRIFYPNVEK